MGLRHGGIPPEETQETMVNRIFGILYGIIFGNFLRKLFGTAKLQPSMLSQLTHYEPCIITMFYGDRALSIGFVKNAEVWEIFKDFLKVLAPDIEPNFAKDVTQHITFGKIFSPHYPYVRVLDYRIPVVCRKRILDLCARFNRS